MPSGVRKSKKKQVKDELDRLKQAEKKKRRLEKALATSAAIRSELEKKKQKKIEEQQRLDEEGAAIAEAVALHVLLGEDSDDSCKIMLNNKKNKGFSPWDCPRSFDFFVGGSQPIHHRPRAMEGIGFERGNSGWSVSSLPSFVGGSYAPYADERSLETRDISAELIAAQAVASLQIAEDAQVVDTYIFNGQDSCVDTYVFNRMLRG